MPKVKKGRKAQNRDRSPRNAVSEQSTDVVAQATIEVAGWPPIDVQQKD